MAEASISIQRAKCKLHLLLQFNHRLNLGTAPLSPKTDGCQHTRPILNMTFVLMPKKCIEQQSMLFSGFNGLSTGFPYFTNVVQLLCLLSGWLHLHCSSIGTGFNGAETNCRIAHNLGILLMNSNCFAISFSGIIVMSVQISIYPKLFFKLKIKVT